MLTIVTLRNVSTMDIIPHDTKHSMFAIDEHNVSQRCTRSLPHLLKNMPGCQKMSCCCLQLISTPTDTRPLHAEASVIEQHRLALKYYPRMRGTISGQRAQARDILDSPRLAQGPQLKL